MKTKKIIVKIDDFSNGIKTTKCENLLENGIARMAFNFDFSTGALKDGTGVKLARVKNVASSPEFYTIVIPATINPAQVYHYRFRDPNNNFAKADKLVIISKDYKIYQMSVPNDSGFLDDEESNLNLTSLPKCAVNFCYNNRDVLLLCFENDNMYLYDASKSGSERLREVTSAPQMLSVCKEFNRLFAVVPTQDTRLWYSSEKNPTLWDSSLSNAGYIDLDLDSSPLTKVVNFENAVYAFSHGAIAKILAYADNTQFKATKIFETNSRIFEDTICVCGDRILFLTQDGLYAYNGANSVTKILMDIENVVDFSKGKNFKAIYHNGKFYLACKINFEDGQSIGCEAHQSGYLNNAVVVIDLKKSELNILRGLDINFFNVIKNEDCTQLFACNGNYYGTTIDEFVENLGENFLLTTKKIWQSGKSDLGYSGKTKILKSVEFFSNANLKIEVSSESESQSINVVGSNALQKVFCNVKGKEFEFKIVSQSKNNNFKNLCLNFDVVLD